MGKHISPKSLRFKFFDFLIMKIFFWHFTTFWKLFLLVSTPGQDFASSVEPVNLQSQFLSFSRDGCHHEVIWTNHMMTSIPDSTRLVFCRRKYVKPESQATAKHKWHCLVFDPNTMKLPVFLEELNQGAEEAFGDNAQEMYDHLLYAKLPPKMKRSVNMARPENGSYDEIVTHLERELELNALEESDDLPMATMTSPTSSLKLLSLLGKWLISPELLQGKKPYDRGLREIENEEIKRCPTRQIDSEESLPGVWDLWQEKSPWRAMLAGRRCAPQT